MKTLECWHTSRSLSLILIVIFYRLRSEGDNVLGSVRPSVSILTAEPNIKVVGKTVQPWEGGQMDRWTLPSTLFPFCFVVDKHTLPRNWNKWDSLLAVLQCKVLVQLLKIQWSKKDFTVQHHEPGISSFVQRFFSPPVHLAWWAHMRRFPSVCPWRYQNALDNNSYLQKCMSIGLYLLFTTLSQKFISANGHGIPTETGRAHCQRQVAFFIESVWWYIGARQMLIVLISDKMIMG